MTDGRLRLVPITDARPDAFAEAVRGTGAGFAADRSAEGLVRAGLGP